MYIVLSTPQCRRCFNGNETVEHLLCEFESLTMSGGRIFGPSFGELQQLSLTCPSGSISTVYHRNRTSWEIIDGGAQWILKGRSALGSNDHPIKINTTNKNTNHPEILNFLNGCTIELT